MICKQCGVDFDGRLTEQKFCSRKCQLRNRRDKERERKGIVERVVSCKACGTEFVTWNMKKQFCSIDCNNEYHRRH